MATDDYTKAKAVYDTVREALIENGWKFQENEESLQVSATAIGEDLPMEITLTADAERQLLVVFSRLPISVPADVRIDLAVAVCFINNNMVDGCFDYDVEDGKIFFRLTSSFIDSEIGKEAVMYMVLCSCGTIDKYNDKLMMLSKGTLTVEQFLASEME